MYKFEVVSYNHRQYPETKIQLPTRATTNACAYDFYAPSFVVIPPKTTMLIWTDVKARLPERYMLMLNIRSSMGKKKIALANLSGWADADYYSNPDNDGNIGLLFYNWGTEPFAINEGDRIAQGMILKYNIMDDDTTVTTRSGGFGSTGK